MTETVRLTVGQAVVRFLAAQRSVRDGEERPFFAGVLGIFGHGNVAGLGQALLEDEARLRYVPARNEQAMVHVASGYAKATNRLCDLGVHVVGRARRDKHGHGRRARHGEPAAGAAPAGRRLRHAPRGSGAPAARAP